MMAGKKCLVTYYGWLILVNTGWLLLSKLATQRAKSSSQPTGIKPTMIGSTWFVHNIMVG